MKTRNGTEAPEGRPSGIPGASSKAATRRGPQKGEPAKRPDKPESPGPAKGASPSAAPAAVRRGPQKGEAAKRPDRPESPGQAKGASPSADPAATAQMRQDGTPGPKAGSGGDAAQSGSVIAFSPRCGAPRYRADRANPGADDPEATLRRILHENCPAESRAAAEGRTARPAQRDGHSGGPESGSAGSGGSGGGGSGLSRTGRRKRGTLALGSGFANFPLGLVKRLNPALESLLGSAAKQTPSRQPGRAKSPGGSGGGIRLVALSERWREPLSGVPVPRQVREALDVFVKLTLRRTMREVTGACTTADAFGVGQMLWSLAHRGLLADEAAAFATLRKVFGAESDIDPDGPDGPGDPGDALPCNRRTAIHALRHAGLLDPALSVRVVKPAHVMPGFCDALAAVSARFGVPAREIVGRSRRKPIAAARFAVMAVQREVVGASYAKIGRDMGGRHHSSATHAVAIVASRRRNDPELDQRLTACVDDADATAINRYLNALRGLRKPVLQR